MNREILAATYGMRSQIETLLVDHEDMMMLLGDYCRTQSDSGTDAENKPAETERIFIRKLKSKMARMRTQLLSIIE